MEAVGVFSQMILRRLDMSLDSNIVSRITYEFLQTEVALVELDNAILECFEHMCFGFAMEGNAGSCSKYYIVNRVQKG